nr:Chain C, HCV non-structural protein 4A [synthetic construct]3P8N_D Chain D, HCV non-structural protein 4A [synthetic construct]3P8O_C Chain C, HCV non-structural protein 4A [synthetic construct]3P8O_D Chain D, HCV non-structural protein 4A [synthetic construct]4I31_C Chain C, HCV non-structural protein 4A [Hepatitis C virus (isolate Japanese)]4I31_D Chain D, HCV non-structural protein 4A [Hepatitis C virus (isolate Japanese)]4I32_C Chain C, HCV non-structural protein 4A [Hepatitis C virus 
KKGSVVIVGRIILSGRK